MKTTPGRKKVKLNLYLEPKVVSELGELAEKREISRSEVVEQAVRALMKVEREVQLYQLRQVRYRRRKNGNNHTGV